MRNLENELQKKALRYGFWRELANKTKTMQDRIKFVHSETALGRAAQNLFEAKQKELAREERRKNKS